MNSQVPPPCRRSPIWLVSIFTLAYLTMAALAAGQRGNLEFVFYIAVVLLLAGLVAVVHGRVNLSTSALWCLSLWGLAHMAGGLVSVPETWPISGDQHVLYSLWLIPNILKYDQVVHAYGFGITTWVCWQGLRAAIAAPKGGRSIRPTLGLMLVCAAAGMGFGALNEVVEFFATLIVPETNVGGYINTGWDLVANTMGSICAAVVILIREK